MKRITAAFALLAVVLFLSACSAAKTTKPNGTAGTTPATASLPSTGPVNPGLPSKMVGKDKMYLHVVKVYDPAKFPKTSMNGEPSDIHFFKPTHDEGVINRDYPSYDAKTFKFLSLPAGIIAPQDYYMLHKNGGSLNQALKGTGYKAVEILDQGHIKILPNLYLGYYDFAWVPLNVMTEYWSGNESMSQELWRAGDDYVVVGASYDGGISLMTSPQITDIKQLAGQTVGIMNPAFNIEALLNKSLSSVGLSTVSTGGSVKVEMGSPGFVMNDLLATRNQAVFAWGSFAPILQQKFGYHPLTTWDQMGYGTKVPYVVLVVRKDILQKHPDIVQKVVQLNYDATKQALTVGDYKKPEMARFNAFKTKYMGLKTPQASKPALVKLDAQASPVFLNDVVNYMTKCGYFRIPYTYSQLVDQSFYNKVKK